MITRLMAALDEGGGAVLGRPEGRYRLGNRDAPLNEPRSLTAPGAIIDRAYRREEDVDAADHQA